MTNTEHARIELRADTAANWTTANPTLAAGEPGYETDTKKLKIGDGATAWNALAYYAPGITDPEVVRDTMATALVGGTNVTVTVDDPGDHITIAASPGGSSGSVVRGTAQRTAGDLTISSTTFAALNGSNVSELDITIAASAGDVIAYMPSILPGSSAPAMAFDVGTIVSGSVVNYLSGGVANGISGFYRAGGSQQGLAGMFTYVVQAGDISGGNVTLRILAAVSSSSRGISASGATPIKVAAMNLSKLA